MVLPVPAVVLAHPRTAAEPAGPAGPEYQVNTLGATFDIDQVTGTNAMPATVDLTAGQNAQATFFSTNFGQPWELLLGTAPLIPLSGGAFGTFDGQFDAPIEITGNGARLQAFVQPAQA